MTALSVENLSVEYLSRGRILQAVENVTFDVPEGKVLGLVGESGSGKSTIGRAIGRLLSRNGSIAAGSVKLGDLELTELNEQEFRQIRWSQIAMIFQGAMKVLDPVYTVGSQVVEAIRVHRPEVPRKVAWARARELLEMVAIPGDRIAAYPHELSGGMKQRINIAMAMALEPEVIIADEPTTALDVISQDIVMECLMQLQADHQTSMILISHDMGLIAENADLVGVLYSGKLVERASVTALFDDPSHPYTMGLINAIPDATDRDRLVAIPGFPPPAHARPAGCDFRPRCPFERAACKEDPPWLAAGDEAHRSLCHFVDERADFQQVAELEVNWASKKVEPASLGSST